MNANEHLSQLSVQLSHLYSFARKMNELDFAASLFGEFRGMQDPGWATTITAHEVFDEINAFPSMGPRSKSEIRVILMLYCQLAEAGGVYEALKNVIGIITLQPYILWPFKDLVRVKKEPKRIIGPNANATFRDLATAANTIGMTGLSSLLETTFSDDIRNGISHADYVIWDDGLRLRKRNGGYANRLSFEEVNDALMKGVGFFELLREHNRGAVQSFYPPKEVVGRFSANFPMPWTIAYDPENGSLGISGSSPGPVTTPEFVRQENINNRLGGRVLATFTTEPNIEIEEHIAKSGFEPNSVVMDRSQFAVLVEDVHQMGLWDERQSRSTASGFLIASPWGFRWLDVPADFDSILEEPTLKVGLGDDRDKP